MICKYCKKDKNDFPKAHEINGKIYYRKRCQQCYVASKYLRRKKIKKQFIEYKKELKCNRCDNGDYRVLEFHHINDNKEFNISEMLRGHSFENILKEIEKCEILCANCHRIHHYDEKIKKPGWWNW